MEKTILNLHIIIPVSYTHLDVYKRQVKNPVSRFWQKQKIKRQYAKAARAAGQTAQGAASTAKTTATTARKAAKESKKACLLYTSRCV